MNEGVKIVCDKILEHPHITDANSISGEERRWMHIADYIIENDYDTFDQEDVDAVKNAIREARRKYFTANVLDHVMWETDPSKTKTHPFDYPPLPKSQKVLKHEREAAMETSRRREEKERMEYEYRMKAQMGMRGPHATSDYSLANGSNLLGGTFL